MTLEELAYSLIVVFEGEKLTSYQDTGGVWTIGIGHTKDVTSGQTITRAQSQAFFAADAAPLLTAVRAHYQESIQMTAGAALVSFGFNCGLRALREVLAGQDLLTAPRHTTDRTGKVLSGLVRRRGLEEALILAAGQMA